VLAAFREILERLFIADRPISNGSSWNADPKNRSEREMERLLSTYLILLSSLSLSLSLSLGITIESTEHTQRSKLSQQGKKKKQSNYQPTYLLLTRIALSGQPLEGRQRKVHTLLLILLLSV